MAAKPPHEDAVHCPPTTAYDGSHGEASSMTKAKGSGCLISGRAACYLLVGLVAIVLATMAILLVLFPEGDPKYSVAVAAVAGLDPARDLTARSRPTLSPVLNVTVHLDNSRNAMHEACVSGRDSKVAAEVSYGDAFLGRGTVPPFCAKPRKVRKRSARAWGQDVVVPWFLRDELAAELAVGEAAVDVQLMPWGIVCRAKIGGGLSRCGVPESE